MTEVHSATIELIGDSRMVEELKAGLKALKVAFDRYSKDDKDSNLVIIILFNTALNQLAAIIFPYIRQENSAKQTKEHSEFFLEFLKILETFDSTEESENLLNTLQGLQDLKTGLAEHIEAAEKGQNQENALKKIKIAAREYSTMEDEIYF